jgi:hypothetical protein
MTFRSVSLLGLAAALSLSAQIVPAGAKLEQIFSGGVLTEGVTSSPDGTIYFSDITFTHQSGMQAGPHHEVRSEDARDLRLPFAPAACRTA